MWSIAFVEGRLSAEDGTLLATITSNARIVGIAKTIRQQIGGCYVSRIHLNRPGALFRTVSTTDIKPAMAFPLKTLCVVSIHRDVRSSGGRVEGRSNTASKWRGDR